MYPKIDLGCQHLCCIEIEIRNLQANFAISIDVGVDPASATIRSHTDYVGRLRRILYSSDSCQYRESELGRKPEGDLTFIKSDVELQTS